MSSNDIEASVTRAKRLLEQEKDLSPALRAAVEMLLLVVAVLFDSNRLNSRNSSKPPSSDLNRKKTSRKESDKSSGGQKGHIGKTLEKIKEPDETRVIEVDRRKLPKGRYREIGFETRQVFDIDILRYVIEYQAQVLEDETGKRFVAPFPKGVTKAAQYGESFKAHAVYLSQYQLLPYGRLREYFVDQLGIPVSEGTLYNFNREAFEHLAGFEEVSKAQLGQSEVIHADETGINIKGAKYWLHCASNNGWTHFSAHKKRGKEAMDEAGILPQFKGVLCHDHWKSYYRYDCTHALCNAHHQRELTRAIEHDQQVWAEEMKNLLNKINQSVKDSGGVLKQAEQRGYRKSYRRLLEKAEIECPPPIPPPGRKKRGRLKRSKSRNLLERLIKYEDDVLRFMMNQSVPFTNNLSERDIRMTKVHQKISGCFRSVDGARMFCRIRGYLSTCRKHGLSASNALTQMFKGNLPDLL